MTPPRSAYSRTSKTAILIYPYQSTGLRLHRPNLGYRVYFQMMEELYIFQPQVSILVNHIVRLQEVLVQVCISSTVVGDSERMYPFIKAFNIIGP